MIDTAVVDPWATFLPTAGAPKRKDWRKASWGDVANEAITRLPGSFTHDVMQTVRGLPSALGAMGSAATGAPTDNPTLRLMSSVSPVAWGGAGVRHALGGPHADYAKYTFNDAGKDLDTSVRSANDYLYNRYTAPGALKQTLATDPGSVAMDVGALASIPEGGEGMAARMPGLAGSIARGAVRGSKVISRATNPIALAGEGVAAASKAGQVALRGGPPLTKAGAFTPKALAAVHEAFPNGEITAVELAQPRFRDTLAKAFQAKGINAGAVKDAVLQYNGAPTPRSVIARAKPSQAVAATSADAVAEGRKAIGSRVSDIAGQPSGPAPIGEALEKAHAKSLAAAEAKYKALRQMPGSFGKVMDGGPLNASISGELDKSGMPSTPELMAQSADAYPQASKAWSLVNDALVNGKTRLGGEITAPELMEVRRQLTAIGKGAQGSDSRAVQAVISGFQNDIEKAADATLFRMPDGTPVNGFAPALKDANDTYRAHHETFSPRAGPGRAVGSSVKVLQGGDDAGLAGTPDLHMSAQRGLDTKLRSPAEGPATRKVLSAALDSAGLPGSDIVDSHIRQSLLTTNEDGTLKIKPENIRSILDSPMADVFSPAEQSDLRLAAAGEDVLKAKPLPGSSPSKFDQAADHIIRMAPAAATGALMAHFLPVGDFFPGSSELIGGALAGAGEHIAERTGMINRAANELKGAPADAAFLDAPQAAGANISRSGRALAVARPFVGDETKEDTPMAAPPEVDLSTAWDHPDVTEPAPAPAAKDDPWSRYVAATPTSARTDDIDLSRAWNDSPEERAPRASGGRVDPAKMEQMVRRLMGMAKQAKKRSDMATKPLLSVPDEIVAKALRVAQEAA